MSEHENKDVDNKSANEEVTSADFKDAFIEPDDDPENDPEEGNDDGGNGTDGEPADEDTADEGEEESSETDEESAKPDDSDEEPADEEGAKSLDIEDEARLVIGGEPVLYKELKEAFTNRKKWQKENTQKAQEIAEQRKEIEREKLAAQAYSGVVDLLKKDPDLLTQFQDYVKDKPGAAEAVEKAIKADPVDLSNPYEKKIKDLEEKIQMREAEDKFKSDRHDCMIKYDLSKRDLDEIEKIIFDEFRETGVPLHHEKAFRLWRAEKLLDREKNKKPNPPEKPKGKVSQSQVPKKRKKGLYESQGYGTTAKDFEGAIK